MSRSPRALLLLAGLAGLGSGSGCLILDDDIQIGGHPCVGNRTDTLWADDAERWWVGCGSTTEGTGLYASTDGGRGWASVDAFDDFRVSHVHRAADGVLYVAGTQVGGPGRVWTEQAEPVFESTSQTWNNYHVGSFVRLDDGTQVAESLTGAGIAWRPDADTDWADASGWPTDDGSYQILDSVQHDGRMVGVGSTITQPPTVFVQTAGEEEGLHLEPVVLEDIRGELWSVDSDGSGLVAGGVDQDASTGRVYVTDGDPTDRDSWLTLDVSELVDGDSWIRGVCRRGQVVAAVGEDPVTQDGILLISQDGGLSWQSHPPLNAPPLSQCAVLPDGSIVMVGALGWVGQRDG